MANGKGDGELIYLRSRAKELNDCFSNDGVQECVRFFGGNLKATYDFAKKAANVAAENFSAVCQLDEDETSLICPRIRSSNACPAT